MSTPTYPDNQKTYRYVSKFVGSNFDLWAWQVENTVNGLMKGQSNNIDSVTLTSSASTTNVTLAEGRISQSSVILFMPTTANAAAEQGNGTMYVSSRDVLNNYFTITHASNAQTDRTFKFAMIG